MTLLDWAEQQALENLKFRLSCLENLLKECSTTLTILLAGFGATAAYSFKLFESNSQEFWLLQGVLGVSLYLLLLSSILVIKCMRVDEIQVPTNEPNNIYQPEYELDAIREVELNNIQARINLAIKRNHQTARWLNLVRLSIIASPVVFTLSSVLDP